MTAEEWLDEQVAKVVADAGGDPITPEQEDVIRARFQVTWTYHRHLWLDEIRRAGR